MKITDRIKRIPPYIFAVIDQKKSEAIEKGLDVIDLGIGDPDLPTPKVIVDALVQSVQNPSNHDYPPYQGTLSFREAVAVWYKDRFNVDLDPKDEVISLIGSKEGIAHAFLTFLDPGDIAILPDPGYPVYKVNTLIAGGVPFMVPVKEENGFQMDLESIPEDIRQNANMLFVNYPNNPTGAVATDEHLQDVVDFGLKYNILICMDLAYSEVNYDGYVPKSILEFKGAKDIAIEFHSLSKSFNMTGWRIGMAVGNKEAVQALGKIKTNVDSGIFKAIQEAGIVALQNYKTICGDQNRRLAKRRDIIINGLNDLGWNLESPKATYYIWAPVPEGMKSQDFTISLLETTGILVVPGTGYGPCGEGYFRISITTPEEKLEEAVKRLKAYNITYKKGEAVAQK